MVDSVFLFLYTGILNQKSLLLSLSIDILYLAIY